MSSAQFEMQVGRSALKASLSVYFSVDVVEFMFASGFILLQLSCFAFRTLTHS